MSFREDYKEATQAYIKNKFIIQKALHGDLISLELEKNELHSLFDLSASTDILLKSNLNGVDLVYGVAMRMNKSVKWHNHITIRYTRFTGSKTEFEKTITAINQKALNSCIGIQIDVTKELDLINGIVYDRYALFSYVNENIQHFKENNLHTVYDGNTMFYINYAELNKINIKHKVFHKE